ncbi:unnamed protein product [Eruca vesicaria subsp. sativa]|uniref:Uncharacterized protein n=1 Tax=Eruca vesicaria subsp. sativa TaxID=29727 RepID=A0ABC8KH40_ERUVS|nr:unnamed protein product [Eruca vesicaria subsp. sativa]
MDVDLYGYDQDSEYTEVNNGVDQNRNATCAHVTKLHHSCPRRVMGFLVAKERSWFLDAKLCECYKGKGLLWLFSSWFGFSFLLITIAKLLNQQKPGLTRAESGSLVRKNGYWYWL